MKNAQLLKESRWAVWLTFIYLFGWLGFAYFSPISRGFFGFPLWFEAACLYLPVGFIFLIAIMIKTVYQEIELDGE